MSLKMWIIQSRYPWGRHWGQRVGETRRELGTRQVQGQEYNRVTTSFLTNGRSLLVFYQEWCQQSKGFMGHMKFFFMVPKKKNLTRCTSFWSTLHSGSYAIVEILGNHFWSKNELCKTSASNCANVINRSRFTHGLVIGFTGEIIQFHVPWTEVHWTVAKLMEHRVNWTKNYSSNRQLKSN